MTQTIVSTWGDSLAVRVPRDVAEAVGLGDGQKVEIVASSDALIIRKPRSQPKLGEMFDGRSPEAWRTLYADAYDWGPDQGRERLDE